MMSEAMVRILVLASATLAVAHPPHAERVTIPAGPFTQGSTRGEEDERPAHKVTVKAFAIDRTEVTRGDYDQCVAAHRCKPVAAATPVSGAAADAAKLPVTGVDWSDAQAFCRFAGGRLPTETEWE